MMKMRKVFCIILPMVLLFSSIVCFGEEGTADFASWEENAIELNTELANAMDYTSTYWLSTATLRGFLTGCLVLDLVRELENPLDYDAFVSNGTYMGKSDTSLYLVGRNGTTIICVIYSPMSRTGAYFTKDINVTEEDMDGVMEDYLTQTCKDGYYKNDIEEIMRFLRAVSEQ